MADKVFQLMERLMGSFDRGIRPGISQAERDQYLIACAAEYGALRETVTAIWGTALPEGANTSRTPPMPVYVEISKEIARIVADAEITSSRPKLS